MMRRNETDKDRFKLPTSTKDARTQRLKNKLQKATPPIKKRKSRLTTAAIALGLLLVLLAYKRISH